MFLLQFDEDKSGRITSSEIGAALEAVGEKIEGYKVREIIAEVDSNKDGEVQFEEFLEVSRKFYKPIKRFLE